MADSILYTEIERKRETMSLSQMHKSMIDKLPAEEIKSMLKDQNIYTYYMFYNMTQKQSDIQKYMLVFDRFNGRERGATEEENYMINSMQRKGLRF